jgi:hypothetical protein
MKNLTLVLIGAMLVFSCNKEDAANREVPSSTSKAREIKFYSSNKSIPNREKGVVLFKLKDNSSLQRVTGRVSTERIFTKAMERAKDNGFYKVRVQDEEKTLQSLKNNPDVEWASFNYTETTQGTPDDPYWNDGSLWGMANINMPTVWQSGNFGNKQVVVGVIDEGIFSHDDLCENIWTNPYELDNGIDDDGNGYIDDFHGWDWFNNDNEVYPGATHGTHVAGTIGARGGNQRGVIGVNSNVTLISCKFLENYGYDENAVKAIDYLIDLKQRHGINIKVTSNSWGGGGYNQGLKDAIVRAKNADILFVAAAGNHNGNNDLEPNFPCGYDVDNIISVGASDWSNNKASFSCFGATTVDIFAPGTGVISTVPTDQHTSGYAYFSGTSMATPHVSGVAALYAGINPEASYLQIKNAILNAATKLPQLKGLCLGNEVGGNFLNAASFTGHTEENQAPFYPCPEITPDANPPSIPQNLDVYDVGFDPRPGPFYGGYFGVRWDRSIDPEGSAVGYVVYFNDVPTWYVAGNNYVFAGFLDTTQDITVRIYAVDSWGNVSGFSNSDVASWGSAPPPPPDTQAPTLNGIPTTSNITTSAITFNHSAASDNVGVTGYTINWRAAGGSWLQRNSNNLSETFSSLSEGTTYEFNYTATDAAGNVSAPSQTISATTLTTPPPPGISLNVVLNGGAVQTSPVQLTYSITTNGTVASKVMKRKQGNGSYVIISTNPGNPFSDSPPTQGNPNYIYRLEVTLTNGQFAYSEKTIQVKKK